MYSHSLSLCLCLQVPPLSARYYAETGIRTPERPATTATPTPAMAARPRAQSKTGTSARQGLGPVCGVEMASGVQLRPATTGTQFPTTAARPPAPWKSGLLALEGLLQAQTRVSQLAVTACVRQTRPATTATPTPAMAARPPAQSKTVTHRIYVFVKPKTL